MLRTAALSVSRPQGEIMLTGECFCGAVNYQIDGDLNGMYYCHCSRCRKLTGSSFSTNGSLDASLFVVTKGQEFLDKVSYDQHFRYHCRKCHSWVYGDSEEYPGMKFIPCGTLNEAPEKAVDHHVCVDSKAKWITINDNLPQYPGAQPKQSLSDA